MLAPSDHILDVNLSPKVKAGAGEKEDEPGWDEAKGWCNCMGRVPAPLSCLVVTEIAWLSGQSTEAVWQVLTAQTAFSKTCIP